MYLIDFFKKSKSTLLFLFFFTIIFIPVLYFLAKPKSKLPVFSPSDVNPRLVDESVRFVTSNHTIADFTLINQEGDTITQDDYKNTIYVADFFFTRCQTICPKMTFNMRTIQDRFINDDDIKFLSHTVTPVMDSVPVLKQYAIEKGVISGKWNVTTGNKQAIYNLARKSYFAVLDEGDGGEQDFIHTEQFILIDKYRRIRGFYDGTDESEMDRIIKDIEILKLEE